MTGLAASPSEPPSRPGFLRRWPRRAWRTFKWLTLLLLIAAIGYIAWTNHRGRVAVERVIAALEARDIPVGLEQWERGRRGLMGEAWHERYWDGDRFVAPAHNAALVYEAAFVLANRIDRDRLEFDVPFLGTTPAPPEPCERIHPELTRQLDAFVQQHSDVFDLLAKARTFEQCDFAIDPTQKPVLNHSVLGGARFASYLLQIQSLRAQAHGDTEQVAASIAAMLDLAAAMDDEPSYSAGMVQLSMGNSKPAVHRTREDAEREREQSMRNLREMLGN